MIRTYASPLTVMALAAALCLPALCVPAHGQEQVRLRASYQGGFLPDGTSVVVLARDARVEQGGRIQPEFIPRESYPRREELVHRRDVLEDGGFSSRRYERSDRADRVYFLYALGPDSTLYWSYSAERDALKFDVVSTGVMSVAPIRTSEVRDDILDAFFGQRVVVRMPGDGSEVDQAERGGAMPEVDAGTTSPAAQGADGYTEPQLEGAAETGTAGDTGRPDAGVGDESGTEHAAAQLMDPGERAAAQRNTGERAAQGVGTSADPPVGGGIPLVPFAVLALGAAAVGAAYFARKYYREARRLRLQLITVKEHAPAVDDAEARRELEALRHAHASLQREHAVIEQQLAELSGTASVRE
ncbi:MAG: hypothetical protein WD423_03220 [Rhodothermales bacterium]